MRLCSTCTSHHSFNTSATFTLLSRRTPPLGGGGGGGRGELAGGGDARSPHVRLMIIAFDCSCRRFQQLFSDWLTPKVCVCVSQVLTVMLKFSLHLV